MGKTNHLQITKCIREKDQKDWQMQPKSIFDRKVFQVGIACAFFYDTNDKDIYLSACVLKQFNVNSKQVHT